MKQYLIILTFLFIWKGTEAQRPKEFQVRAGLGFGFYGTTSEFGIDNDKTKDRGGAVTLYLPLDLRYEITRRFNVGLDIKYGSYLYDPDSADGKSNFYYVVGSGAEFNLKNKEDFRWYAGAGINFSGLALQETNQNNKTIDKENWKYSGFGFRFNTGVLIYFVGDLGFNFNLGFDSHAFKLRKFEQDGREINLDDFEAKLKLYGVDGTIGLVYRFN